ncbi:hypothetical protein CRD_00400 [Raphidiopsis brookii D9]|nr:hypothetical protein CRD_00400 [Raphidiopsis brookii D9]
MAITEISSAKTSFCSGEKDLAPWFGGNTPFTAIHLADQDLINSFWSL